MTDYIISREWIYELMSMHVSDARKREIRDMILTPSAPSPNAQYAIGYEAGYTHANFEHDTAIRNATLKEVVKMLAANTIYSDDFSKDGFKFGWILVGGYDPIISDLVSQ
jgi:hypothetical protein